MGIFGIRRRPATGSPEEAIESFRSKYAFLREHPCTSVTAEGEYLLVSTHNPHIPIDLLPERFPPEDERYKVIVTMGMECTNASPCDGTGRAR